MKETMMEKLGRCTLMMHLMPREMVFGYCFLLSPKGKQFLVAIKLQFDCTNNVVKYEVCVSGLLVAITLGVKKLEVLRDSALVIYQVNNKWSTMNSKLIPYQKFLAQLIEHFQEN